LEQRADTCELKEPCLSALEVFLNDMRYVNPRFTYLLTYLLTWGGANPQGKGQFSGLLLPSLSSQQLWKALKFVRFPVDSCVLLLR